MASFCNGCEPRSRLRDLTRPNLASDVSTIQEDTVFCARCFVLRRGSTQLDVCLVSERHEPRFIVQRGALPQGLEPKCAVHRTAVQIQIPEDRRNAARDTAFPGASRTVNGDGESGHFGGTANLAVRLCFEVSANPAQARVPVPLLKSHEDRKSTRLNSSHSQISYAVFCLKKNKIN